MKTTVTSGMFRNIANPRRTTLAHLEDAGALETGAELPDHTTELPNRTANPRRTILMETPENTAAAPL
ncbi:hypothetical protein ACFVT5_29280 [Streptomyces sp. NPDC058001]|uniref:hypothetical protein n=1 Tax=Streptomyces sp. NPDC058001 TaxID=3346300 RepID=UPI0036EF25FD